MLAFVRDESDPRASDLPILGLILLVLLASATGLANGFAYDDRWIIVDNPNVHEVGHWFDAFGETYWPSIRGAALYRPLTIIAYIVQWAAGSGTPLIFHVVNVVLYAAVTVLVYFIARELLPFAAAWVAAALFAVHPVHVEAVGNVVGQAELWSSLVVLAAILVYLRARRDGVSLDRQSGLVIACLYLIGMLFKENGIVLPALLAATEAFLVRDARAWRERLDEFVTLSVWLGLLAAIFLGVRVIITGEVGGDVEHPALRNLSMWQRSWVMLAIAPEFARLFLWPQNLFADYSPREVPFLPSPSPLHAPGALLVLCLIVLAVVAARRWPLVTFALAWLAITLAPTANILLPTGILLAERTLFLPSVGVVLAIAGLVPWCQRALAAQRREARLAAAATLAGVLLVAASWSADRTRTWKDSDTVFNTLAADAKYSFKAHYARGGMLWEEHRAGEAELEWRTAIGLFPDYYGVYQDLAHKYREAHVCPAAIPLYKTALAIESALPYSKIGLVACYLEISHWREARSSAHTFLADGEFRKAYEFMIERADSALVANDTLDGSNRWGKKARVLSRDRLNP